MFCQLSSTAVVAAAAEVVAWTTFAAAEYGFSKLQGQRQHYGTITSVIELVSEHPYDLSVVRKIYYSFRASME